MHWIIENNPHSETTTKFIEALNELKFSFSLHTIVPFSVEVLEENK